MPAFQRLLEKDDVIRMAEEVELINNSRRGLLLLPQQSGELVADEVDKGYANLSPVLQGSHPLKV